jgi:Competence protein CoiA-like family
MDERSGAGGTVGVRREIRCPSCSRLLALRSGPAITPHFAHRPRQSCRRRPGRPPVTALRLEQLTLFDPADVDLPTLDVDRAWTPAAVPNRRRRRRRAWLPRLIRWVKGRPGG